MLKNFGILSTGLFFSAVAHADLYTFGINNTSTTPSIYQINLTTGATDEVFELPTLGGSTIYNGLAMDPSESKPIFYFREGGGSGNLLAYSPNFGLTTVATAAQMTAGSSADAALYNGRYWWVTSGSDTLKSVEITFDGTGKPTGVSGAATLANFDGTSVSSYGFGDIAITSTGRLYGSSDATRDFFRANISISGTTISSTSYSDVTTTNKQLQIAYDQSAGEIYGYNNTNSTFFRVTNLEGGSTAPTSTSLFTITSLANSSTTGLVDLVDVVTPFAVPEPGTWQILLGALAGLAFFHWRRRPS